MSVCYTLPWLYLALLDSTTLYHGSTWQHVTLHCAMALLDLNTHHLASTGVYLTLLHPIMSLRDWLQYTMSLLGSTWLYYTLTWDYWTLLGSTWLYYSLPWLYSALLDPTTLCHGSTWQQVTLLDCAMALLDPTTRHLASTGVYLTLLHSIMALLNWLQSTLAVLGSKWLYYTPALLVSTPLFHGSTWLYLTLVHSTLAQLGWLYHTLPRLYFALLDPTTFYHGST